METKFQTSFIPKKPLPQVGGATVGISGSFAHPQKPTRPNSLFLSLTTLLFIASLVAAGGMYGWKSLSLGRQETLKQQLADREKQFNPDLIEELKRVNFKIDSASQILANHIALSNIFDIIGRLTIEKVRFTRLDLTAPTEGSGDIKISMKGYGAGLSAVAYQSDVLGQLEQHGLRKIVKNPILSNPTVSESGLVLFDFSASIDPSSLNYARGLSGASVDVPTDSTSGSGTTTGNETR